MSNWRHDYWEETLAAILDEHEITVPVETIRAMAVDLAESASLEREASGESCAPNPLTTEIANLKRRHAEEVRDLERVRNVYCEALANRVGVEARRLYVNGNRVEVRRT